MSTPTLIAAPPPLVEIGGQLYPHTLSTSEAAAWLGYCERTLLARRGTGTLPVEPLPGAARSKLRWPTVDVARAVGLDARLAAAEPLPDGPNGQHDALAPGD